MTDEHNGVSQERRTTRVVLALVAAVSIAAGAVAWQVDVSSKVAGEAAADYRFVLTDRMPSGPTTPAVVLELAPHPLLAPGVTLPDVECALPPLGETLDSFRAHHGAFVTCLDAMWGPTMTALGLPHSSPPISYDTVPDDSPCGPPPLASDATGWFCQLDDTIYLPLDRVVRHVHPYGEQSHLALVAHEYAHHVQELSGLLLAAEIEHRRHMWDSEQAMEVNRRIELQANCFAGLAAAAVAGRGTVSDELARGLVADFGHGDDVKTHGTARLRGEWTRRGFVERTTDGCNTWAAEAAAVR